MSGPVEEPGAVGAPAGGAEGWPERVQILVSAACVEGMQEIAAYAQTHWSLRYDRPELLRLVAQVAIAVIEAGLVVRQGLHFALALPGAGTPSSTELTPSAALGVSPARPRRGRPRATPIWVGGGASAGFGWIHAWMQERGAGDVPRGAALELAVDLSLQALAAGLVPRPRGPHVTIRRLPPPFGE